MPKVDRRILRTRKYLGNALLELIQEKGYEKVTIRDLAERADVAYATFFRHYESKSALLMEQLEQVLQNIEANAAAQSDNYFFYEGQLLFEHFQSNVELYSNLLTSAEVIKNLKYMIIQNLKPKMAERYEQYQNPKLPLDLLVYHSVSTLLSLVNWWLENKMPYSSKEMAIYYERLVIQSAWWAVGDDIPIGITS